MGDSSHCDKACDGESVGTILNQMTTMRKFNLQPLNINLFSCSDGDVCSVISMKEGCGSPMSSRASDPETDISSITSLHIVSEESVQDVDLEGNCGDIELENQFVCVENNDDGFSWEMDNRSYEELLNKFIEKEIELRNSNLKLQLSEQEIFRLKVQVENSESQINDMHNKLELKEDELYEQKELSYREIFKLATQIKKGESQLDNVRGELNMKKGQLDNVHEELKLNKDQLFMMNEELTLKNVELDNARGELNLKNVELDNVRGELNLKNVELDNVRKDLELNEKELNEQKELGSKSPMTHQLQCQIKEEKENIVALKCKLEALVRTNEDNDINHKEELRKLISTMFDLHVKSFWKKEEMRSDIASLSKKKEQLTCKLEYYESRNKKLEQAYMKLKTETQKTAAQLKILLDEISYLRKKLGERMNDEEAS